MTDRFGRFFTNDKVFLLSSVISVLFFVIGVALDLINAHYYRAALDAALGLCVIFLYYAYCKHDKNVMKGLMGTLLGILVLYNAYELATYAPKMPLFVNIVSAATIAVTLIFFVNHFLIASDHHASSKRVRFNQVLIIVLLALNIAKECLSFGYNDALAWHLLLIFNMLAYIGTCMCIACVESRLDIYKTLRDMKSLASEDN